jgi:hypothetical protein
MPRNIRTRATAGLLDKDGLNSDATFEQVAASTATAVGVAEGWEDKVVMNDLCYGCWLDRQTPE